MTSSLPNEILVYSWNAWDGYLASFVFPHASVVYGDLFEDSFDVGKCLVGGESLFLFQVNLTKTAFAPVSRDAILAELDRRGIRILNRELHDISKRWLQNKLRELGLPTTLATREGPPQEYLIVKTNENYMGEHERMLSNAQRAQLHILEPSPLPDNQTGYYVAPRSKISAEAFDNSSLIIERYIKSKDDTFFRIYKAAELVIIVKSRSTMLIKKVRGDPSDENIVTTLEELADHWRSFPQRLGIVLQWFFHNVKMDYGCLDVVTDGSEFYIIDVNLTPWGGDPKPDEFLLGLMRSHLLGTNLDR